MGPVKFAGPVASMGSFYFPIALSIVVHIANVVLGWTYLSRQAKRRPFFVTIYVVAVFLFELGYTLTLRTLSWLNGNGNANVSEAWIWVIEQTCPAVTVFLCQAYFAYQIKLSMGESAVISSAIVGFLGFGSLMETIVIVATTFPPQKSSSGQAPVPAGLIAAQIFALFPNILTTVILFPVVSSIKQPGWNPTLTKIRNIIGSGLLACGVQVLAAYSVIAHPNEPLFVVSSRGALYVLTTITMLNSYEEIKESKEYHAVNDEETTSLCPDATREGETAPA